jgi:hypothetical protein
VTCNISDTSRPGAAESLLMNTTRLMADAMDRRGTIWETSPIKSSSRYKASSALLA